MKLYDELSEYYYAIESNHRNIRDDIALILSVMKDREIPSILDLGCGTGEHMAELSRRGFNCTGVDAGADMLRIASQRHPRAGSFIHADITDLDYFEEFDLVMSLFGTLNYLVNNGDINSVLWNAWRALKISGQAVFEVWNSFPILQIRKKDISKVSVTEIDGTTVERHRGFVLLEERPSAIVEVNYRYIVSRNGRQRELTDRHVMRAFSRSEMEALLTENGFRIKAVYATSRQEEFREKSNKMIIHAEKG